MCVHVCARACVRVSAGGREREYTRISALGWVSMIAPGSSADACLKRAHASPMHFSASVSSSTIWPSWISTCGTHCSATNRTINPSDARAAGPAQPAEPKA